MSQWAATNLMHKLAAAASILLVCATAFVPALLSSTTGKAIVDRHGAEVALYTTSFAYTAQFKIDELEVPLG